jgi:hypothetical protein
MGRMVFECPTWASLLCQRFAPSSQAARLPRKPAAPPAGPSPALLGLRTPETFMRQASMTAEARGNVEGRTHVQKHEFRNNSVETCS